MNIDPYKSGSGSTAQTGSNMSGDRRSPAVSLLNSQLTTILTGKSSFSQSLGETDIDKGGQGKKTK